METHQHTIKNLFQPERRFLIPIFQRGYVWTEFAQWSPLWRDVVEQALVVRQEINGPKHKRPRKHFLGALVISADQNRIGHVTTSSVIDGQQRLTTFQLLLAAFRDCAKFLRRPNSTEVADSRDHPFYNTLVRLTQNDGEWPNTDEVFKVWPTNAFQDDFRRIMAGGSAEAIVQAYPQFRSRKKLVPVRPGIVEAYLFFSHAIDAYLRGSDAIEVAPPTDRWLAANERAKQEAAERPYSVPRAQELLVAIQDYMQIVSIELGHDDDPQVIFETLNARGVELESSDLVRNYVFMYATRRDENPTALYDAGWRDFEEGDGTEFSGARFWRVKERQGRLTRDRIDLFFFHYVTCRTNREIKIGHLFDEFRDWWSNPDPVFTDDGDGVESDDPNFERSATKELRRVRDSASVFKRILAPNKDTRFGRFAARLKILDTTTVFPLLLWLAEQQNNLPAGDLDGIHADLESYLVRRMVCGLTAKNYNQVFLNLLRRLRRKPSVSRSTFQAELTALQGESSLWPDDSQFIAALIATPLYRTLQPARTLLILEGLEQALRTSKGEDVRIVSALTVEHVLPQSASLEDWPYPDASTGLQTRDSKLLELLDGQTVALALKTGTVDEAIPVGTKLTRETLRELKLTLVDLKTFRVENKRVNEQIREIIDATPKLSDEQSAGLRNARYTLRDTIGNLTLLTQGLNSSVGNGPFRRKRPAIAEQSSLRLNTYFQRFTDDAEWNEGQIVERGRELAFLACKAWPRPAKPGNTAPVQVSPTGE